MASGNPFVGPKPLTSKQPLFGRAREVRELSYLLTSDRIVLLHSPSGAGKSSLLSAKGGLIDRVSPNFDVCGPLRVNEQPARRVANRFLWSVAHGIAPAIAEASDAPSLLDCAKDRDKEQDNLLLIFDQFEEILTFDPAQVDAKRIFFDTIGELLTQRWIWALFVLREDYLAQLDPYVRCVPTHLNNRYRLDLLRKSQAQEAIEKTAASTVPKRIFHPDAISALKDSLSTVNVTRPDGTTGTEQGEYVEPLQLQLVCFDLWEQLPESQLEISPQAVKDLGNVTQVLRNFYDRTVKEVARTGPAQFLIRSWIHERLISNGRRDQVQFLEGAASSEGLDNRFIQDMLRHLLLRREPRGNGFIVELAHDRLIAPVLESNADWFESRLSTYEKRARLWEKEKRASGLVFVDDELKAAREWRAQTAQPLFDVTPFFDACDERQKILDKERTLSRRAREWLLRATVLALGALVAVAYAIYYSHIAKQQEANAVHLSAEYLYADVQAKVRNAQIRVRWNDALAEVATQRNKAMALYQQAQAETARANTANSVATARQLLAISTGFPESDPQRALWAVASSKERASPEATRQLADVFATLPKFVNSFVTGEFITSDDPPMAFSPDGAMIAGVHSEGALYWGNSDGSNLVTTGYRHPSPVLKIGLSSNRRLAFSDGAKIFVADITPQGNLQILHSINGSNLLAISPDGNWIASRGAATRLVLHHLGPPLTRALLNDQRPLANPYSPLAVFSVDGAKLISSHISGVLCVTELQTTDATQLKPDCGSNQDPTLDDVRTIAMNPNGVTALGTPLGVVDIRQTPLRRGRPQILEGHEILSIVWRGSRHWQALCRDRRTEISRIFDSRSGAFIASIPGNAVTLHPLKVQAISRDLRFLNIYDYGQLHEPVPIAGRGNDVPQLSGDGKLVAILTGEQVAIRNAVDGQLVRELTLRVKTTAVHLSYHGRFLLAINSFRDNAGAVLPNPGPRAEVVDLASGSSRIVPILLAANSEVEEAPWAIADDGTWAIHMNSGFIRVDLRSGRGQTFAGLNSQPGREFAIDANGARFAYRGETPDGFTALVLRSLPLGPGPRESSTPVLGMKGLIASLAFRSDGKVVAVAGNRGDISIYDASTLAEIARRSLNPPISSVAFHPSGDLLVLHRPAGTWQIQRILKDEPQTLSSRICSQLQFTLGETDWKRQAPSLPYRNPCPDRPAPRDPTLF